MKIQSDKILHFLAGAACAAVVYYLCLMHFNDPIEEAWVGSIAGVVAGVAKESLDSMLGKPFDLGDILATAIGSLAFLIISLIFYWII